MITLISSANTMSGAGLTRFTHATVPRFQPQADAIAHAMAQYTAAELKHILKVSYPLAEENYYRFQHFFSENPPALPSLFAYTGVVYKNIQPTDFTAADMAFAVKSLRIASFLYGLLTPADFIKPYRIEPFVELPHLADGNMYAFWQSKFTNALLNDLQTEGGVLINLASASNFKLFNRKNSAKNIRVITPVFKIVRNGKMFTPVIYIKMARGQMVRYIIKNRVTNPDMLKSFTWGGFMYCNQLSDAANWVFVNNE